MHIVMIGLVGVVEVGLPLAILAVLAQITLGVGGVEV
jgi:hypothetical protein